MLLNARFVQTVDYGGTQVIPRDTIQTIVHRYTPRKTMKDLGHTKEEMLQFFVRYAICAVPKEETRRSLNAVARRRWKETRKMQDTEENRDAEHYYACILDVLTASDIATSCDSM
jgi:hypothetical protein